MLFPLRLLPTLFGIVARVSRFRLIALRALALTVFLLLFGLLLLVLLLFALLLLWIALLISRLFVRVLLGLITLIRRIVHRILVARILAGLCHLVLGQFFTLGLTHWFLNFDRLLRRFKLIGLKVAIVAQSQPIFYLIAHFQTQRLQIKGHRFLDLLGDFLGVGLDQIHRFLEDFAIFVNVQLHFFQTKIVRRLNHQRHPGIGWPKCRAFRTDESCGRGHIFYDTNVV